MFMVVIGGGGGGSGFFGGGVQFARGLLSSELGSFCKI